MNQVIQCESGFNPTVQSQHRYHAGNVPPGYTVGSREMSFGLTQIHLPAHPNITYEQAIDPEFSIEFLAKNLANGKGNMWTCYKQLAMR